MNTVRRADATVFLKGLRDECVDTAVTSPPYWGLRDYGVKGQIGLEATPQEYVGRITQIFRELRRVLKPHGSLYLNLGDTYCSTKGSCVNAGGSTRSLARSAYKDLAGKSNPNRMLAPDGRWLQPKQLLMIPARVAISLQDDGWILRNAIIWHKPNGMPSSVKDRLTNKHEYVFHFVKSERYYFNLDAIRTPHRSAHPQGASRRTREGRTRRTERHLLGLRARGKGYIGHPLGRNPGDVLTCSPETRTLGAVLGKRGAVKVPGGSGWLGHPPGGMARIVRERDPRWLPEGGRNPGDFWSISPQPFRGAHFAVFPEALCETPIKATCPSSVCACCGLPKQMLPRSKRAAQDGRPGRTTVRGACRCAGEFHPGVVLDPFAGSGTALAVAAKLGRFFLGCDLNGDYVKLARARLRNLAPQAPARRSTAQTVQATGWG